MNTVFLTLVLLCVTLIEESTQDCRILADCDGRLKWKPISLNTENQTSQGVVNVPRGRRGLPGQKGEPGAPADISELKRLLKSNATSKPSRFFYESTMTWTSAKAFCDRFDKVMCTYDQICNDNNGGRELVDNVIPGDHWVPLLDDYNDWTEIGDAQHVSPCERHIDRFGPPSWGTTTRYESYKGFVYCCDKRSISVASSPDIIYQYIGEGATYNLSKTHCEELDRRLCYSSEVCENNSPRYGSTRKKDWIAVMDTHNEWLNIGHQGRSCELYSTTNSAPSWGIRETEQLVDYVGFVYCCKELEDT